LKRIIIFMFLIIAISPLFAYGTQETWITVGGEYGHFRETQYPSGVKVETTLNSIGGYSSSRSFESGNTWGTYIHSSILIPQGGKIGVSGSFADYSMEEADLKIHLGFLSGPVYRSPINEGTDFYFALGPSLQELIVTTSSASSLSFMLGVGIDIGMKYNLTESYYLDFGVIADYCFAAHTSTAYHEGWSTNDYSLISFRPHIGIGTHYKTKYQKVE